MKKIYITTFNDFNIDDKIFYEINYNGRRTGEVKEIVGGFGFLSKHRQYLTDREIAWHNYFVYRD